MKLQTKIILVIGGLFLLILAVQMFIDTENWLKATYQDKRVEIRESRLLGYDSGKKSWEIEADYIWAGRNKYIFRIDEVKKGKLFNSKGRLVLDDIKAKGVRVNSKSKVIIATNNITAIYNRKGENKAENRIKLSANELKYIDYNKRTFLEKNVYIESKDTKIFSDQIEIDNNEDIVIVRKDFYVMAEDYFVSANIMVIDIEDNVSELKENVVVFRPAQIGPFKDIDERETKIREKDSWLKADFLNYEELEDDDALVNIEGNIKIYQKGKLLKGDKGEYQKKKDFFVLKKNVYFESDNLTWLLEKKKRESFKNPKIQKAVKKPVKVKCDYLEADMKAKTLLLKGKVEVTQEEKIAKCDELLLEDDKKLITLIGNVYIKKAEGDILTGKKIIVDINKEEFWTADEQAEIEFFVEEEEG